MRQVYKLKTRIQAVNGGTGRRRWRLLPPWFKLSGMGQESPLRRHIVSGIVAGVVVLALVVIGLLGGFAARKSQVITVSLGRPIDTGMLVYLPQSATVTYRTTSPDRPWEVVITMKVRNPRTESLQPVSSPPNVVGVDPRTRLIAQSGSYQLSWGVPDSSSFVINSRKLVPPSNKWMILQLRQYPDVSFDPGQTYMVAFRQMEYSVTAAYGYSNVKNWSVNSFARSFIVEVPLTRLPDQG